MTLVDVSTHLPEFINVKYVNTLHAILFFFTYVLEFIIVHVDYLLPGVVTTSAMEDLRMSTPASM